MRLRWVCRDGRVMHIGEMADGHLANAIAMIERGRNGWRMRYLPRLYLERGLRKLKRMQHEGKTSKGASQPSQRQS